MASKGSGIYVVVFDTEQKLAAVVRNVIVEPVKSFPVLSSCISFIERKTKENNVIVLITTTDENDVLEQFESLESIEAIFVLLKTDRDINTLPSKVIGVYLQTETLLRSLSETLDTIEVQLNVRSILFNYQLDRHDNTAFYFYNIWKNSDERKNSTKKFFVKQVRLLFQSNNQIQSFIDDFETSYKPNDVLTWLNKRRYAFPYYLFISNALRTHNQEILSMTRFFLDDMNKQMEPAPFGQVYLGTKLPISLVERLEQHTKTDVIAFQCFLRVTQSRANAFSDATKLSRDDKMINVLFKIELNRTLCIPINDTVLIDMATPFQIKYVTRTMGTNQNQKVLITVKLRALDPDEGERSCEQFKLRQEKLEKKSKALQQKTVPKVRNDEALADEYIARGEWPQAVTILARITDPSVRVLNKHGCLLREHLNDLPGALECHQQALLKATDQGKAETLIYLGKVYQNMKQYTEAFESYSQALGWFENQERRDLIMIARCLVGMGTAQRARGRFDDALDYAERALAIREHEIKPRNDFDIAACLGNIGNILYDQADIERALTYATRATDLLSTCGKDDPRFAAALNNLGGMYQSNGDLVKAREYFERALESLPNENHLHRESTLANIAQLNIIEQSNK